MLTLMIIGPRSGSGVIADVEAAAEVSPRLTSKPDIRHGRNSTVEFEFCRRWDKMMPQASSVTSISRPSGSAVGSDVFSEGVAAGVKPTLSGETPAWGVEPGVLANG